MLLYIAPTRRPHEDRALSSRKRPKMSVRTPMHVAGIEWMARDAPTDCFGPHCSNKKWAKPNGFKDLKDLCSSKYFCCWYIEKFAQIRNKKLSIIIDACHH